MTLPWKRFIVNKHASRRLHREPALLFVNREARAIALEHYTMRSANIKSFYEIQELYIDFRADAFAYDIVDLSWLRGIKNDIANDIADDVLAKKHFQAEITNKVCIIVFDLSDLRA